MEFSNLFFLYIFLPLSLGLYFLAPGIRGKNFVLLLISLLFYALGDLRALPLLLLLSTMNYFLASFAEKGKFFSILAITLDVLTLVLCKLYYADLPLGLSFFTFSLIAYQADLWKGKGSPCRSFVQFLLFVSLFPKLLMGPIVRYESIKEQLSSRSHEPEAIFQGTVRFVLGLSKKILLADRLYELYAQLLSQHSNLSAWGAALAFMLYIYFEFSGYADMAIGLGRIFGFTFCENFDRPYLADSVSAFWRRWHISLGQFFKDYVYIPLGGNRKGIYRQWGNMFLVWVLTVLWHGFRLPFLLWGLYFFLILLLEKTGSPYYNKIPSVIRVVFTQLLVLFGWVIFAAEDGTALYYSIMKLFVPNSSSPDAALLVLRNGLPLILTSLCFSLLGPSVVRKLKEKWQAMRSKAGKVILLLVLALLLVLLLVLCTASLLSGASKPSMYASF